jgi:8-oxo-dGTP pyrophosphatase MutT (NUDIX family)
VRPSLGPDGDGGAASSTARAVPRPAATVAILRNGDLEIGGAPEVLLTHRPATMAFGPNLHVFPGGGLDPADSDPRLLERLRPPLAGDPGGVHGPPFVVAAIREAWEETGILLASVPSPGGPFPAPGDVPGASFLDLVVGRDVELRGDWLVPLSRWVTPPVVPRRYDTRFFVAWLPDGAAFAVDGREVIAAEWITPTLALDAMAGGRIELWMPTSTTLQQLGVVRQPGDLHALAPLRPVAAPVMEDLPGTGGLVTEIRTSGAGGVPGRAGRTWVVGRRELVVIDPGDPSDEAADSILAAAAARAGSIRAVAVSAADPDSAAGGEGMALRLEVPLLAPAAAARRLAADVRVVAVGERVEGGDEPIVAVASPDGRADAVGYRLERNGVVLGAAAG